MLFRILHTLRTKPKAVRQHYALGTAVVITAVIGGVWSLSLPARFANSDTQVASGTAPFAGFFARMKAPFANLATPDVPVTALDTQGTTTSELPIAVAGSTSTDQILAPEPAPQAPAILIGTTTATITPAE